MRFALSLAEQGLSAILTFAVNIWFIRNGAASAYGTYVFWLSVAFATGVAQGTLVLAHLSRLPSARDRMAERLAPESLLLTLSLGLLVLTTAGVAVGEGVLGHAKPDLASPAAILFVPAFLLFQYARTFAFSRQRPGLALGLTGGILLAVMAGLALERELGEAPTADRVLLVTGLAYGGVSVAVLLHLLGGNGPMLRWAEWRRQAGLLRGSGWLLLGAGSSEATSRLYSFVTVGRFGTEALAAMSAVQVVIRPAWLLSAAWTSIGFPSLAAHHARHDRAGFVRAMAAGGAVTASLSLIWTVIVAEGWPWIAQALYQGRYAEIGPLAWLWGVNVVVGSIGAVLNVALLSLGSFRILAMIDCAGAVVTALALGAVAAGYSYPWAIAATILGQMTQVVLESAVLLRRLRLPVADAVAGVAE